MSFLHRGVIPALLFLVLLPACGVEDEQSAFWTAALSEPEGITTTTPGGAIESEDPDDWRTSPAYRGVMTVEPPFPNPNVGQTVHLSYTIFLQGGPPRVYVVVIEDDQFKTVEEHVNEGISGTHQMAFNPSAMLGEPGLYRFLILDDRDELISYGDISVE